MYSAFTLPELPHVVIAFGHHHGILLLGRDWLNLLFVTALVCKRFSDFMCILLALCEHFQRQFIHIWQTKIQGSHEI
jgi:hypothetical protein